MARGSCQTKSERRRINVCETVSDERLIISRAGTSALHCSRMDHSSDPSFPLTVRLSLKPPTLARHLLPLVPYVAPTQALHQACTFVIVLF